MLARLTWCLVVYGAVVTISVTNLYAQAPKAAAKSKGDFAGSKAGDEWDGNDLKMKFCWCPPGTFKMGSPASEPDRQADENQVSVTLTRGFWLGKYEVTQAEWKRLMGTTLREQRDKGDKELKLYGEGDDYPIHYVIYREATLFCRKLTEQERRAGKLPPDWEYRLPTEAQWEYACRADTATATAFGDKLSSSQANFDGSQPYNGAQKGEKLLRTARVGSYKANAWGLHDMHGNLFEWCRDAYKESLKGGTDPETEITPSDLVILRGGSWFLSGKLCRSAFRYGSEPYDRLGYNGLRVAIVQVSK